jgi:hypothetical protein
MSRIIIIIIIIIKYVNPWKFGREQNEQRLRALRQRDGDNCTRSRRPLRFGPAGRPRHGSEDRGDPAQGCGRDRGARQSLSHPWPVQREDRR